MRRRRVVGAGLLGVSAALTGAVTVPLVRNHVAAAHVDDLAVAVRDGALDAAAGTLTLAATVRNELDATVRVAGGPSRTTLAVLVDGSPVTEAPRVEGARLRPGATRRLTLRFAVPDPERLAPVPAAARLSGHLPVVVDGRELDAEVTADLEGVR